MIGIGIGVSWAKQAISVVTNLLVSFKARVASYPNSIFEAEPCLAGQLTELNRDGLLSRASLVITPNAYSEGVLYDVVPNSTLGDMGVVRATTATRVNSSGLIESLAVNVPRLDYTGSTCPSILVEPQRTNLCLYSEEFDNAYWTKTGTTTPIITANSTSSPNGTMTADLFTGTGGLGQRLQIVNTLSLSTPYSISVFLKANTATTATINVFDGSTDRYATLTFSTGAVSIIGSGITASVINFTNGWYRLVVNYQSFATTTVSTQFSISGSSSYFIWGAQLEQGSNATSYIPTTTASVTRNADLISKTGISSLIGQTEGTIYFETNKLFVDSLCGYINISESTQNRILIYGVASNNQLLIQVKINNVSILHSATFIGMSSNAKVAFGYKNGDSALYINGVKYSTTLDTINYNFPATLSKLDVMNYDGSNFSNGTTKVCSLFKTRLTNTQLQQLTTL